MTSMKLLVFALTLPLLGTTTRLAAHPHVFVDGGVDFVMRDGHMLDALQVTWLYDEFETLYILSSYDLSLSPDGTLSETDRLALIAYRSDWPADFDGSAHPHRGDEMLPVEWPSDLDLDIVDGRLRMTFRRVLKTPQDLSQTSIDVGFYESTYFFAFEITHPARFIGDASSCRADLIKFDPDAESEALRATLKALGREDIPQTKNVGALFADRLVASCD